MAVLDASLSEIAFTSMASYGSLVEASPDIFSWLTPDPGHQVRALGVGLTYQNNIPTGGTVTTVTFDFIDKDHPYGFTDVTITGIAVPATGLVNVNDPAAGEIAFWELLLGGNDTIKAPLAAGGALFGDFLSVQASAQGAVSRVGADDTFFASNAQVLRTTLSRGGSGSGNALVGDALAVAGVDTGGSQNIASLTGGDDQFFLSNKANFTAIGDVQVAGFFSEVIGGKDVIESSLQIISATEGNRNGAYIGDVEINLGKTVGGADTIKGSNFAFTDEIIAGDAGESGDVGAAATLIGGDDVLMGRAGQEFIAGDVYRLQAGTMTGGNDRILGGQDSDVISGDALQSIGLIFQFPIGGGIGTQITTTVTLSGGNDRLFGDEGNDWIVGDMWNGDGIAEPSTIAGGNDVLFGGDGDDMLYGDIGSSYVALLDKGGDDILDGGLGNDILDGQLGVDTASFASLAAAVVVDLAAGTATGQGADLLSGIENATGSERNDTLLGDAVANVLTGGGGNDLLNGRDGNDKLFDGSGKDDLRGGAGIDTFMIAADGAADKLAGGADADGINLAAATSDTTVTFTGKSGAGAITGGGFGADTFTSMEIVAGSDKAGLVDTVIGSGGAQLYFLRRGNDIGLGGGGDDLMAGEAGNDRLDGGSGNDLMNGGTGADTFVFSAALNAAANVDEIEDLGAGADIIELSSAVFTGLSAGGLAAAAFASGSGFVAAQDGKDRIVYDTSTGDLYFDQDGAGGLAAIKFATLQGSPGVDAGDFLIT